MSRAACPETQRGKQSVYTCIVVLGGVAEEEASALERHLEGKIRHMQKMLRGPASQELLKRLVQSAENVRTGPSLLSCKVAAKAPFLLA